MTSWRPSGTAKVVFKNAEIEVFSDGTWLSMTPGEWKEHPDAVVYAAAAGDARVRMRNGRSKLSLAVSPSGKTYDVRAIAQGAQP